MSMAADIASLELIAAVHQLSEMNQAAFEHLVHRLEQHVAHFEWVGLYLQDADDDPTFSLVASAGEQSTESIARKAILQVPIHGQKQESILGKLTITSKKAIAFDESDYTSLTALACELGKKIEQTRTHHQ